MSKQFGLTWLFVLAILPIQAQPCLMGDVTGDFDVSVSDASAVLSHLVGLKLLDVSDQLRADVSGNGMISVLDAAQILEHIVGQRAQFKARCPTNPPQQLIIPLYQWPAPDSGTADLWEFAIEASQRVPVTVIVNPFNGPVAPTADQYQPYMEAIAWLRTNNLRILGYIQTQWIDDPPRPDRKIRTVDEIKADVDLYHNHYDVDGIFFDQASQTEAAVSTYADLCSYARAFYSEVVLNPGTAPYTGYLTDTSCNRFMIAEFASSNWSTYLVRDYLYETSAAQFAAVLHSEADAGNIAEHLALAAIRNIASVFVTDAIPPNPYGRSPVAGTELINAVEARNTSLGLDSSGGMTLLSGEVVNVFDPNISTSDLYNCSDFETHDQAWLVYRASLTSSGQDVHRLDADDDGIPCEGLR